MTPEEHDDRLMKIFYLIGVESCERGEVDETWCKEAVEMLQCLTEK